MKLKPEPSSKKQHTYYIDDDGRAICSCCNGNRFITSEITRKKFYKPGRENHWEKKSRHEVTTECGNCLGEGSKDWVDFLKDGGFTENNMWWSKGYGGFKNSPLNIIMGSNPRLRAKQGLPKFKSTLDIEWILTGKPQKTKKKKR